MKHKIIFCLALVVLNLSAQARVVRSWSDAELLEASDLVVVGQAIKVKGLDETNSLGWLQSESFRPRFRGVETTFKISDALQGMPANDQIVLHHYRDEIEWGSPPDGPAFITFTPNSTNKLVLYLIKDGKNRYAPVTGQVDPSYSIRPLPTNYFHDAMFATLPPIADADSAIRHPVQVHIPVRLHAERYQDSVVIKTDELALTNLTVGSNMVTGTACEAKIYQGDKLVNDGPSSLQDHLADGGYSETFERTLYGFPKPGESYTIVVKLTMFETDLPGQHFWSPRGGKKYKVLCEQTFKLPVE